MPARTLLLAMQAGDYDVTVFQDAFGQGAGSVDAALSPWRTARTVDQKVYIPFKLVTPANMGEFLPTRTELRFEHEPRGGAIGAVPICQQDA